MDTLSVFLADLENRWNWRGDHPLDKHVTELLFAHLGITLPSAPVWSHYTLSKILEAVVERMDAEVTPK